MNVFQSITDTVGRTPLVRLKRISSPAEILLKLEFFNPLGSVKDRIGVNLIETAERDGTLKPGTPIVEPTSGNTGIALAFVAAAKGYPLTLVMPETMSAERRTLLLLLGAEVILTPAALGMRGAVAKAMEIQAAAKAFMPGQFRNPANPEIHRKTTALEIWNDTDGKVDAVVTGVGTGGTLTGVGVVLKTKKATVQMVAVEPVESAVISGEKAGPHKIQGIGAGFIPKNLNRELIDQVEKVSSEEAIAMAKRVIKEEGVPVGISSGAAVVAALRYGQRPENKGKVVVVIIPSYTERYLSTLLAAEEREKAATLVAQPVLDQWLSQVKNG